MKENEEMNVIFILKDAIFAYIYACFILLLIIF